jgi:8-oxo-dGTP diphosphatase
MAIESGIRLIQLRAHGLDQAAYRDLAHRVFERCDQGEVQLLLNRALEQAHDLPRHGLHLTASLLMALKVRPGRPGELVGASCHDAAELRQAERLGLDYALLSPVQTTASHPNTLPLGWGRFADLVDAVTLPVYALGGLAPQDLNAAFRHGAQGIASIQGLWPNPG